MSACVDWLGCVDKDGYGRKQKHGRNQPAHRLAYEDAKGPIPEGLEIDHLCRNRRCVNPDHLEAVTHLENMQRRYRTMTHCKWGHEFTGANTYIRKPTGHRQCRACNAAAVRKYERKAA